MISGGRTSIHAAECADRAGKHAFGLNDTKAIAALRKLADDIEAGTVVLNSVTTSSHATHEEFAVREVVIEVLEDYPTAGPRMVREWLAVIAKSGRDWWKKFTVAAKYRRRSRRKRIRPHRRC